MDVVVVYDAKVVIIFETKQVFVHFSLSLPVFARKNFILAVKEGGDQKSRAKVLSPDKLCLFLRAKCNNINKRRLYKWKKFKNSLTRSAAKV